MCSNEAPLNAAYKVGTALIGEDWQISPYTIVIGKETTCSILCDSLRTRDDKDWRNILKTMALEESSYRLMVDELISATMFNRTSPVA